MGPIVVFSKNTIKDCFTSDTAALINLFGIQRSFISDNHFFNCNKGSYLIKYEDWVRAIHIWRHNTVSKSGEIIPDKYVQFKN
jgi:hypothetical protein